MTLRKLPVRGNRSEAVTATSERGGSEEGDEMQGGRECFHAKVGDMRKTDVGLCLGNGPRLALLV